MFKHIKQSWQVIRTLSGDDAYDRYLVHFEMHHTAADANENGTRNANLPLSRAAYFKEWQDDKWKGIKRCC
jgi:uncharacterized short protein YbdD (DUF466 family)